MSDNLTIGLLDDRYIESLVMEGSHYTLRYWNTLVEMTLAEIKKCDQILIDFYLDGIETEPCARAVEKCKDAGIPCAIRTGAPQDPEVIGLASEAGIPVISKGSYNEAMPVLGKGDHGEIIVARWIRK